MARKIHFLLGSLLVLFLGTMIFASLNKPAVILRNLGVNVPAQVDPFGKNNAAFSIAGSATCSGRGCHGGIEPKTGQDCWQNEFTLWLQRDPHTQAYDALVHGRTLSKGPTAQQIAQRLGLKKPAHDEPLCLACHSTPQLALAPKDDPLVSQERRFGVGCESCHGPAEQWLVPHTRTDWKKKTSAEKQAFGMVPVEDAASRAQVCAGCHVGAKSGAGAPLRDVTHDLIAAGHPRMQFEFSSFFANLPPHWNENLTRRQKTDEARDWAVGQVVCAEAALELLQDRAGRSTWPELAEFSCYACHHDLQALSWRQSRDLEEKPKRPGQIVWSDWYVHMPRLMDPKGLAVLDQAWSNPLRPQKVKITEAVQALRTLRARLPAATTPAWTKEMVGKIGDYPWNKGRRGWENAEQLFLGGLALSRALGQKPLEAELLHDLGGLRAFPAGVDSPQNFDPATFFPRLKKLLASGK